MASCLFRRVLVSVCHTLLHVIDMREGLHDLLDKAERGELSVVYCPKVDRLGRNARDCLEILEKLHACGVELVLVENNIDTRTPMGKLFFTLLAAFAEWEGMLILERTRMGRQ